MPDTPVTPDKMEQSRFADLSLFHSAVDEILSRKDGSRPAPSNASVKAAATVTKVAEAHGQIHVNSPASAAPLPIAKPEAQAGAATPAPVGFAAPAAAGVSTANPVTYCASLARSLALAKIKGDRDAVAKYQAELTGPLTVCDPHWLEVGVKYAEFLASRGSIPYRQWTHIGDYVIDGKLPANARIAIVGDWGTGRDAAKNVLQQIARKRPDVVIHLGDVYYSGTSFEMENYFYDIWCECLNLPASKIPTFTLAGNHDMFSGGGPYYNLIDRLGQPASYFCLRNDNWQFLAIDTGLHDSKPDGATPTYLEDTEVQWLKDKIVNAGSRKNVLLSHHQLFSAFEGICGQAVNSKLLNQVQDILPNLAVWLWGHEHNQVIYKRYLNVLARCIGHGAFPIGADEIPNNPKYAGIPLEAVRLSGTPFLAHGYALMELNGVGATLAYYVDTDEQKPVFSESF